MWLSPHALHVVAALVPGMARQLLQESPVSSSGTRAQSWSWESIDDGRAGNGVVWGGDAVVRLTLRAVGPAAPVEQPGSARVHKPTEHLQGRHG